MGYNKQTCTEQLCVWNQCFTKKVQPCTIAKTDFYKNEGKTRLRKTPKPEVSSSTPEEQSGYLESLNTCKVKPIVLSTFSPYNDQFKSKHTVSTPVSLPVNLRTVYSVSPHDQLVPVMEGIINRMSITEEQVDYLEKQTLKQASSIVWREVRLGRITTSVAYDFLHTNQTKPAESLIKRVCMPSQSLSTVPAVKWGVTNEANALSEFNNAYCSIHDHVKMAQAGLRLSINDPFLGASPDATIECECCGKGVVEVKCPYKYRDIDQSEIYMDTYCCLEKNNILKHSHKYYAQVQLQMYIFKVDFAQFVLWTPTFCIITQVTRDEDFIKQMIQKLSAIWKSHVLPELITRSIENRDCTTKPSGSVVQSQYCYCKKSTGEQMIGCDNPECEKKWFHLSCLKRKTVPKGDWYCKDCKKRVN